MFSTTLIDPLPSINVNIPHGTTHIPIHPANLQTWCEISYAIDLPGPLDRERFVNAVKTISSVYPNICGRLVTVKEQSDPQQSRFAIHLTGSAIILQEHTVVRENHQPFETLDSVQASLEPFLPEYPCQSLVPDTDSPLVKFRLNTLLPSGRTTLGIAFSHGLADGAAFYRFVRLLSNVYVSDAGSTTVVPPEDHPELLPQVVLPEYPPGQSAINEASCVQQLKPYTFAAANNAYEEDRASTQMATLKLLPDELRRLRNDCHSRVGRGLKVTDQDVLTGWAASLVERMEVPITTLIYMINYRGLCKQYAIFPSAMSKFCGNAIGYRSIPLPPSSSHDPLDRCALFASAVRAEINALHSDPARTLRWISGVAYQLDQIGKMGGAQMIIGPPGHTYSNGGMGFDYWDITFGHAYCRVYTVTSGSGIIRSKWSNPIDENGTRTQRHVELSFRVALGEETLQRLAGYVSEDKKRWNV